MFASNGLYLPINFGQRGCSSNGISTEVLKSMWKDIGPLFLMQLEEALSSKKIHSILNSEIQSLILKGRTRMTLGDYQPISALPFAYKLMTKAMTY